MQSLLKCNRFIFILFVNGIFRHDFVYKVVMIKKKDDYNTYISLMLPNANEKNFKKKQF